MCTKLLLISVVPDLTPKVQTTNNEAITPMIHLTFQQKKKSTLFLELQHLLYLIINLVALVESPMCFIFIYYSVALAY